MIVYQECGSSRGWVELEVPSSSPENPPYLVTIPPWDREEEEISCSCRSYEFRGRCRHQREALTFLCHWREGLKEQTEREKKMRICPVCGSKTIVIVEEEE